MLAFETLYEDRMQLVVEAGIASVQLSKGLVSALGWLPVEKAAPQGFATSAGIDHFVNCRR